MYITLVSTIAYYNIVPESNTLYKLYYANQLLYMPIFYNLWYMLTYILVHFKEFYIYQNNKGLIFWI